ncbi:DUF6927 domain-containing protein [Sphingomonas beigongshangi]|uniref:DUF6927 domain-containing protein n=1 Tax=Sphingomonas beigongshangi TaxID=2782540 RepID=UPI001AED9C85
MSSTNPTRLTETMGSCEANCPQAILDLLTPTENEHALDWRRRCVESLERRSRKVADGDRIRLEEPVTFADGYVGQEFIVEKRGRRLVLRTPESHGRYWISRLMERQWQIVPTTKVHKTIFA